jgi:pyridoxine 5-phosphate synthase
MVELHTGSYALARGAEQLAELERLRAAGQMTVDLGMQLHAGHGLNYFNVGPVAAIPHMDELNIGHSIISRAVLVGLTQAVADMKKLIVQAVTEAQLNRLKPESKN